MKTQRNEQTENRLLAGYEEGRYGVGPIIDYALKVVGGRWREAEPLILEMGRAAADYALHVVGGRWHDAESEIMRSPDVAVAYAVRVLQGRWPEAEPHILKSSACAVEYAKDVIQGRWPDAESRIMRDSVAAAEYSIDVMKCRWPEAEPVILQAGVWTAINYAQKAIGGRWPEAEPIFVESSRAAVEYAKRVIHGRWPEAEDVIAIGYEDDFMLTILGEDSPAKTYAQDVLAGQWDEEVAKKCPCWLYYYAKDVIGGKLPDTLHNRMLGYGVQNPYDPWVKKYFRFKKYQRPPRKSR